MLYKAFGWMCYLFYVYQMAGGWGKGQQGRRIGGIDSTLMAGLPGIGGIMVDEGNGTHYILQPKL